MIETENLGFGENLVSYFPLTFLVALVAALPLVVEEFGERLAHKFDVVVILPNRKRYSSFLDQSQQLVSLLIVVNFGFFLLKSIDIFLGVDT